MKVTWTSSPNLFQRKACREEDSTHTTPWSKMLLMAKGDPPMWSCIATRRAEGLVSLACMPET